MMYDCEYKNVEDIVEGDILMGDDSTPRTVLELCRNRDEMFKIVPHDGEKPYTVNKQHKLVLKDDRDTIEMTVEDYLKLTDDERMHYKIFKASLCLQGSNILTENSRIFQLETLGEMLNYHNIHYNFGLDCYELEIDPSDEDYEEIKFFLRSLGFRLTIHNSISNDNVISELIQIFGNIDDIPTNIQSLTRQSMTRIPSLPNENLSCYFDVVPVGEDDYYGFTIDGNHRFLLSTFDVVRNTGKTVLIKHIMYAKKHIIPVAVAISGTEINTNTFGKVMPSTFIFNEYNDEVLTRFRDKTDCCKEIY
jgi:hypothetical protein